MAMNPFLKEHAGPLVGSAFLHVLGAAAALFLAWYTVAPKLIPPASIEAYVATRPAPQPAAPPAAPAPPAAVPVAPPTPVPDPRIAEKAAEEARLHKAEELRIAEHNRQVDLERRRAAEAEAAKEVAREAQRKAAADAEAQRKALEARRKAEAAEAQRKALETKQRSARESDLDKELAAETHREGVANSGLMSRYISEIQASVERAWHRPPTAKAGLRCIVAVTQVPGGTVTNVRIEGCNGDAAVQQSITDAVHRASPLPPPPDPSLFERSLRLVFEPQ